MNLLLQKLYGKTVAIVSNSIETQEDFSEEIDKHDIVIRFNRFYNYNTGKVGKKTDILVMTFNPDWSYNREFIDILTEQDPDIFIAKKPETYFNNNCILHELLPRDSRVYNYSTFLDKYKWMTTGGALLKYLADNLTNSKVDTYGFDSDESWLRYIMTVAPQRLPIADKERKMVKESIEKLTTLQLIDPQPYYALHDYRIFISFRNTDVMDRITKSEQLKFNKRMVDSHLENILKLGLPVTIFSNSTELNEYITNKNLVSVDVYDSFLPVDDTDITHILHEYCKLKKYDGYILNVTLDKNFDVNSIIRCKNSLNRNVLCGTAIVVKSNKISSYYIEDSHGNWVQLFKEFGPPSVPISKLPKIYRFTGNVTSFHSDAVYYTSIFNIGRFYGVVLNEKPQEIE